MEKKEIERILTADFKLRMSFVYQPQSFGEDSNEYRNSMLKFKVTLTSDLGFMTFNYHIGVGHIHGWTNGSIMLDQDKYYREVFQTGKHAEKPMTWRGRNGGVNWNTKMIPIKPDFCDVVWCLLQDSNSLSYDTFKEWADDYGYNDDSIKDKALYEECCAQAVEFKKLFKGRDLSPLAPLFEDY